MSYTISGREFTTIPTTEEQRFIKEKIGYSLHEEQCLCECCGRYWGVHSGVSCQGHCGEGPGSKPKIPFVNPTKAFILR